MSAINTGSGGAMEGAFCLERESALGGLFQQIINEMKVMFSVSFYDTSCHGCHFNQMNI